METLLENVQNQTEMLQEKSSKLQTSLTEINKNLTTACNGTRNCTGINYQDALKLGANFSKVPDVRAELQNIKKVVNNGLKDNAQQVKTFDHFKTTIEW